MEWYWIVLITIGCMTALAGIIVGIFFLVRHVKRKIDNKKQKLRGKIQLIAVMRLKGSNKVTGLETNEEVQTRLSKLSMKDFLALNVCAYPYSKEQWLQSTEEEIFARNLIEQQILFAFNSDKKLDSNRAKYIARIFD